MKVINKNNGLVEIIADANCVIYRDDVECNASRAVIKESDLENWKEINKSNVPKYTKYEYKEEIIRLIRTKYDQDDEFSILRKMIASPIATLSDEQIEKYTNEFVEYNEFVENCKLQAKQNLNG